MGPYRPPRPAGGRGTARAGFEIDNGNRASLRFRRPGVPGGRHIDPTGCPGTIARITRICFRYPGAARLAFARERCPAVLMQLAIPSIPAGVPIDTNAGDEPATAPMCGRWSHRAERCLLPACLRGLCHAGAELRRGNSVGHALAQELRAAIYETMILRRPFSFHDRTQFGRPDHLVGMLELEGVRMYFSTALVRTLLLDAA